MSVKPVTPLLRAVFFMLLVLAGLVGNYLKFPLFLNIDFIFGSIFTLLAVQIFRLRYSILAGALIASYTFVLWNHPYFLLVSTLEVLVVGVLFHRYKVGLVLADALFWVFVGMPTVYLTYHVLMSVPETSTTLVMCKASINGIANALVARFVYTLVALRCNKSRVEYRDITYNLLAVFALVPALAIGVVNGRDDFSVTDQNIRAELLENSQQLTKKISIWLQNRAASITYLAGRGVTHSPVQMQSMLEQSNESDINILRAGLINRDGISVAFSPTLDDSGHSNIGRDFSDRPYIAAMRQSLQPVLSEVVMSKVGRPTPTVIFAAPVVKQGDYAGYVAGVLSLDQLGEMFEKSSTFHSMHFTLLDKNSNVIITSIPDQKLMAPLQRGAGTLTPLGNGVGQWVPANLAGAPIMERWKSSYYVIESPIEKYAEWKLVLEQPVAPFQKVLFERYTKSLTLLLVILLVALTLAELISRRSIRSLITLTSMTQALPSRLLANESTIDWPKTSVYEVRQLVANFKEMAQSLTAQFKTINQSNELLETRVRERTSALNASLKDKEALLKEVHHRVKNNMQVITSLLRLESRRSTVADTKVVLGDMQARIRAMALLHELLYRTGTFASVDLGKYLSQLSTQAFQNQAMNLRSVQLVLNLGSVPVGMDQAVTCGLLVNELISNCLKHGFPAHDQGLVSIDLIRLDDADLWSLRVADTGVGLPGNFEEKRKESLGLQLVSDLARQIGGELEIAPNSDKGVVFIVNFRAVEPNPLQMPD